MADINTETWSTMVGLLQQIVDILQTSTIAEERGKDIHSKFWAAYKRVSGEYDGNMLEMCNSNMDRILIFAGLFSAANTAFIIAMQPNPVDTTNVLLLQLIQITLHGPSVAQPTILSPSADYSSNFWTQALAYMSLALSLLAAFGAVLGKQWLNYYKTHRYGGGSLEERCKQRHDKFQGLETWWFEGVLQSFSDLLKASLFLFGVSLAAWMWTQQRTISILIASTTVFGFACYVVTILLSAMYPNCPFQTRLSQVIRAVLHPNLQEKEDSTASAMEWMLSTSTYPDAVRAALELLPIMSRKPNVNLVLLYENVSRMFEACFDLDGHPILEDALAYGKALIQLSWNDTHARDMLYNRTQEWDFWKLWHTLYLPRAMEQCYTSFSQMEGTHNAAARLRHQADIRTALCMVVPNDGRWTWDGEFELESSAEEIRSLHGIAEHFSDAKDFEAAGYALILLSGIRGVKSSDIGYQAISYLHRSCQSRKLCHSTLRVACAVLEHIYIPDIRRDFWEAVLMAVYPTEKHTKYDNLLTNAIQLFNYAEWPNDSHLAGFPLPSIQHLVLLALPAPSLDNPPQYIRYCHALIGYMGSDKCNDVRRSALLRIYDLRGDLAKIIAGGVDTPLRDMVLSELSPALLTAVHPDTFDADHDICYLRLMFALANTPDWLPHLDTDGHIGRCIRIIPDSWDRPHGSLFYLAGIFLRIQLAHPELVAPQLITITSKQWWNLMRMAWCATRHCDSDAGFRSDFRELLKALATDTEKYISHSVSEGELQSFLEDLDSVRSSWGAASVTETEAVEGLMGEVRHRLEAV